ncbi:hypothetical protein I7I48_05432 [Histoplasma ohiense]|nr:hypothetical protein I7I48_05432 [Histoplasma ohiense (nom. inval.)]
MRLLVTGILVVDYLLVDTPIGHVASLRCPGRNEYLWGCLCLLYATSLGCNFHIDNTLPGERLLILIGFFDTERVTRRLA